MLCLDPFQTISLLDLKTVPWMSGNLDVLKLYDVLTNFNIYCYYMLLNSAILYLYCIYQKSISNKVKTLCSSGVNWNNWVTRLAISQLH